MEKVKGTSQCNSCYRYVQLVGQPLCIRPVGKAQGLAIIEGWSKTECEDYRDSQWGNGGEQK